MNYSFLSEIKLARAPAASRIRIDEVNPVLSANSTENYFDSLFFLLRFRILTFRRLPHRSLLIAHYSLLIVVLASSLSLCDGYLLTHTPVSSDSGWKPVL